MSSFDFSSYIQEYLGTSEPKSNFNGIKIFDATKSQFTVQALTGGLTNHTARITFENPFRDILSSISSNLSKKIGDLDSEGWMMNQRSVVLKHAPPYIAADPSQAMSVDRQLVEKTALEILNSAAGDQVAESDFGLRLRELFKGEEEQEGKAASKMKTIVRIPKLIWHDRDRNVLWIEDLGGMRTLSEVLLEDSPSQQQLGSDGERGKSDVEDDTRVQIQKMASDLGAFLARLYEATRNPPKRLVAYLTSLSDPKGMYEYLANMVFENLKRPEAGVSSAEAEILADRVRMGLSESGKQGAEDVCLGMVDFWPESVLAKLGDKDERVEEATGVPECGLVDWEYFGPSNAASELGMFLAHLHVHMLNSTTSVHAKGRIEQFAEAMLRAYRSNSSDWKLSNKFKRRALLSHGRELVNAVAKYDARLDDVAKERILGAGVRSLRAAGDSDGDVDLGLLKCTRVNEGTNLEVKNRQGGDIGRIWQGFLAFGFNA